MYVQDEIIEIIYLYTLIYYIDVLTVSSRYARGERDTEVVCNMVFNNRVGCDPYYRYLHTIKTSKVNEKKKIKVQIIE